MSLVFFHKRFTLPLFLPQKKSEKKRGRKAGTLCGCYAFARSNKNPKKAQRNRRPHKHRRKGFFFIIQKKKKIFLCDSLVGCSILDFFSPQKRKKKRIRAFAKLQLKLWLNKNWTQLTTVTRIGFFQPGKEVNSNWKKYETFFFLSFLNQREGEKKTFTFFLLFQTNKKKNNRSTKIVSRTRSDLFWSFSFSKKRKKI